MDQSNCDNLINEWSSFFNEFQNMEVFFALNLLLFIFDVYLNNKDRTKKVRVKV